MATTGPLIEIIPNFSGGRDPATLAALSASARSVPGVFHLDSHVDEDHHRVVLTLVGDPEGIHEVIWRLAREAVSLIDLRTHQGVHPRLGALDVLPFVPLQGATMQECVSLARSVAAHIGRELNLPVWLYDEASAHAHRKGLEAIRRGVRTCLNTNPIDDPAWLPDFGPPTLHPSAGAICVGVRQPLIACNVNLATQDVGMAKVIAKRIRASDGGLPGVKALGLPVYGKNQVQVSMNICNVKATSMEVAYETIQKHAEVLGVKVVGCEVVGMVPEEAFSQVSTRFLKEIGLERDKVLEVRLTKAMG